jgi:hypothetical protein
MNTEIKHLMEEGSSLGQLAPKPAAKRSPSRKPRSSAAQTSAAKTIADKPPSAKALAPRSRAAKTPVRGKK